MTSPQPSPVWNVNEKWAGLQKQSKACNLFIYLFFTQAAIGPSSIQIYQDNNHFIGNYQICAWLVYKHWTLEL